MEKWRGGRFGELPILAVLLYGISCFIFFLLVSVCMILGCFTGTLLR